MSRPKSSSRDLPLRLLRRRKRLVSGKVWVGYYYNGRDPSGRRIEIPLGGDIVEAKRRWADLEGRGRPAGQGNVNAILDRYERDILPGKAPKTRRDDLGCIRTLRRVFGHMRIDSITTQHLAQYRDIRSRHPSMANREIAVLSHVWSLAREWGYTRRENPARGLRRCREVPRRYYADDRVWAAVRRQADPLLLNAMDLCYLTGQRVADVLKMRWADIRDGVLEVQQNKTGARLRILLDREDGSPTELRGVIERMRSVADPPVPWLLALPCGQPLTVANLRARFAKARAAAASEVEAGDADLAKRILEFQVRDIRPKAASDIASVQDASNLLGHTDQQITRSVYIRVGKQVKPTR